jgi:hypothetical protein
MLRDWIVRRMDEAFAYSHRKLEETIDELHKIALRRAFAEISDEILYRDVMCFRSSWS